MNPRTSAPAPAAGVILVLLASVLPAGCRPEDSASTGGGMPPPEVTVEAVTPRTVDVPYEFAGRVEGSREVEVRARVSGILLRREYDEGRPVRKGQTLFVIDPAPYRTEVAAARAVLAEARARNARARREVERLEPLVAERAASRKDFDDALAEAEQSNAAVLLAQARLDRAELDLSYTRVEAPISGQSSRAEYSEGSLVEPGEDSLLTRISQVQPIWVRFSVPDATLLEIRRGAAQGRVDAPAAPELGIEVVLADGTVHPERGRVNFSDSMIDPATGAVDLRAELPNDPATGDQLVPGQFVRVRLLGVRLPDAILVPQRAVLQGQQGKFVYVVEVEGGEPKAAVRPVEVGGWIGEEWVVREGLAAGERVVVDGTVKVRPGAAVRVAVPGGEPAGAGEPAQE